ncbi:MAG TPA: sulfatase [Thermoanaerobaculia bacterium]|nr:sulfatase [Thermoanaerobaculia bacterium]
MLLRSRRTHLLLRIAAIVVLLLGGALALAATQPRAVRTGAPNVLVISVDTLRADRMSGYGYGRPTTPAADRLMARGARFDQARTVEPLTNPAFSSMVTSLYPHEHGATRNGLRMRPRLGSFTKQLDRRGYMTAAFVANWTLKDRISGLGEHFDHYDEVLTRKRWWGLFAEEARAEDVNEVVFDWLDDHAGRRRPFAAWVHYVEPHAPYRLQDDVADRLGLGGDVDKSDRYDSEVAYADLHVGKLVEYVEKNPALARNTLIVFTSDHGESLGEHDYWGHGRHLYEPGLHIPMVFYWPGRIAPRQISTPASNLDLGPTILGLLGVEPPQEFRGYDWSGVLLGRASPPKDRTTWFQAHKGAVLNPQEARSARRDGLLELARVQGNTKEIVQVNRREHYLFDLRRDPRELRNLNGTAYQPSDDLSAWLSSVLTALENEDDAPGVDLSGEDVEKLKALGYID